MGKTVLYLAMSVDGYIADERGGVNWLVGDGSEPDAPGGYPAFLDTVDAIIMGWTTYHQLVTELSPDSWPCRWKERTISISTAFGSPGSSRARATASS